MRIGHHTLEVLGPRDLGVEHSEALQQALNATSVISLLAVYRQTLTEALRLEIQKRTGADYESPVVQGIAVQVAEA